MNTEKGTLEKVLTSPNFFPHTNHGIFVRTPKKKNEKKAYSLVINGRRSFLQKKKKKKEVESHSVYDPTIKLNLLFFSERYGNGCLSHIGCLKY